MRISRLFPLFILVFILNACSNGSEDTIKNLFANTPADSELVAVIHPEKILKNSGISIKDANVDDISAITDFIGKSDKETSELIEACLSPKSGINWEAAVGFSSAGKGILTLSLTDEDNFLKFMEKELSAEWESENNGKSVFHTYKEFAVSQSKLFIGKDLSTDYLKSLLSLTDVESFNSVEYSATLAKSDDDVSFYGPLDGLMNAGGLGFSSKTQIKMASGMFFNDPKYLIGSMRFSKNGIEGESCILNSKLKPSKCELSLSMIDPARVASLGGNADLVAALAVSQKLVKQILDVASSAGGAMPALYTSIISPLDGTIAYASPESPAAAMKGKKADNGFRLTVATNGNNNAALAQMLQTLGKVEIDGTNINVSKGSYGSGLFELEEISKKFNKATFGIAASLDNPSMPRVEGVILTLEPEDATLKLKFNLLMK